MNKFSHKEGVKKKAKQWSQKEWKETNWIFVIPTPPPCREGQMEELFHLSHYQFLSLGLHGQPIKQEQKIWLSGDHLRLPLCAAWGSLHISKEKGKIERHLTQENHVTVSFSMLFLCNTAINHLYTFHSQRPKTKPFYCDPSKRHICTYHASFSLSWPHCLPPPASLVLSFCTKFAGFEVW